MSKDNKIKPFCMPPILGVGHDWNISKFPIYDDRAEFNTNSPAYYEYLARMFSFLVNEVEHYLNQVLRRNMKVKDTESIEFIKLGDWINNGNCPPDNFDDIITLLANVKLSTKVFEKYLDTLGNFEVGNELSIQEDGVFSPDYWEIIEAIDNQINFILNELKRIENKLDNFIEFVNNKFIEIGGNLVNIENTLQKIIDNLYESGAITTNNIYNFEFTAGTNIAHGTMNHYISNTSSGLYIKTKKNDDNVTIMGYE